jgi:hypothetical protein
MCAEASTVLRAVAADFSFECWYIRRSLRITVFDTYRDVSTIMGKAFDWTDNIQVIVEGILLE